ncbi:hypothetical protein OHA68_01575 [Nonomuraea glycinis]|nr:hypothetical protein OHA68_01575 [Nonomuraea glycinis]
MTAFDRQPVTGRHGDEKTVRLGDIAEQTAQVRNPDLNLIAGRLWGVISPYRLNHPINRHSPIGVEKHDRHGDALEPAPEVKLLSTSLDLQRSENPETHDPPLQKIIHGKAVSHNTVHSRRLAAADSLRAGTRFVRAKANINHVGVAFTLSRILAVHSPSGWVILRTEPS